MNTSQKGEIAHLKVQLRATEKGIVVSRPTTEVRYDFILDDGKSLLRAQVKWGGGKSINSENAVCVDLRKDGGRRGKRRKYLRTEIDVLLVYVPELDRVLAFDSEHFHNKSAIMIRLAPTKSGQKTGVKLASCFYW